VSGALTKRYVEQSQCQVPAHRLFPQVVKIVQWYVEEKVIPTVPWEKKDCLLLSPYYGLLVDGLAAAIRPDVAQGEVPEVPIYETHRGPGSTEEVDFWTRREPREVVKSHVNFVVPDTQRWEQQAAYYIDRHKATAAFVKNAGLGFAMPYFHNGEHQNYYPDFIIRLNVDGPRKPYNLILETKGYDLDADVKRAAAERWVQAVNADGKYGHWQYVMVSRTADVSGAIERAAEGAKDG
jgi:type III restriction enzyme